MKEIELLMDRLSSYRGGHAQLAYYVAGHSCLVIRLAGSDRARFEYLFLYGCNRLEADSAWKISEFSLREISGDPVFLVIEDFAARFRVEFDFMEFRDEVPLSQAELAGSSSTSWSLPTV